MPQPSNFLTGTPSMGGGNGGGGGGASPTPSTDQSPINIAAAGQSNALSGLGISGVLTDIINPRVRFYNAETQALEAFDIDNGLPAPIDLDAMLPNVMNSVVSFANRVARENPERDVNVVIGAKRGSSIDQWTGQGVNSILFAAMVREVNRMLSLVTNDDSPGLDYFIWDQGESSMEATEQEHAAALDQLDAQLRQQSFFRFDQDNPSASTQVIMPVIPLGITAFDTAGVVAAQIAYRFRGDRQYWNVVDTNGLRRYDGFHWDNESQFERGYDRYWNAVNGTGFVARRLSIADQNSGGSATAPTFFNSVSMTDGGLLIGGQPVPANIFEFLEVDAEIDGLSIRHTFDGRIAPDADLSALAGTMDWAVHPEVSGLGLMANSKFGWTTAGFFAGRGSAPGRVLLTPISTGTFFRTQLEYDGDTSTLIGQGGTSGGGGNTPQGPSVVVTANRFIDVNDRVNLTDSQYDSFVSGVEEGDSIYIMSDQNADINGLPVNTELFISFVEQGGTTFDRVWQVHASAADAATKANALDIPVQRTSATIVKGTPGGAVMESASVALTPNRFVGVNDRVNLSDALYADFVSGVQSGDSMHIQSSTAGNVNGLPVNTEIFLSFVEQGGTVFDSVWQFHATAADAAARTNAFDIPDAGIVSATLVKGAPGQGATALAIQNQAPRTVNAQQSSTMGPLRPGARFLIRTESQMTQAAYETYQSSL